MSKKIHTIFGLKDPSELGITLTHEHVSLKLDDFYQTPDNEEAKIRASLLSTLPWNLKNSHWIRQFP